MPGLYAGAVGSQGPLCVNGSEAMQTREPKGYVPAADGLFTLLAERSLLNRSSGFWNSDIPVKWAPEAFRMLYTGIMAFAFH